MNSIQPPKPPSFFKVMFTDFEINMRIPPAFMKNFRKGTTLEVPNRFELKCGEKSWWVSSERTEDGCFLVTGWPQFVKDWNLEMGDFLIFRLVKDSVFEIDVYARTCCEKAENIPPLGQNDGGGVQSLAKKPEKSNSGQETAGKRREPERNSGKEENRGLPLAKNDGGRVQSPVKKPEKPNSGKETAVKRRKPEGISDSAAKRPKNSPEKTGVEPEAKKSFSAEVVLRDKFRALLPSEFARKSGLRSRSNIVIKDPEGRKRSVKIYVPEIGSTSLSTGWKKVFKANKLKIGDTVLLKLPAGGDEIELQIPKSGGGKPNSDPPEKRAKNLPAKDSGFGKADPPVKRAKNLPEKDSGGAKSDTPVKIAKKLPGKDSGGSASVELELKDLNRSLLILPMKFSRETGMQFKKEIEVKDPEGRTWPVSILVLKTEQTRLTKGWSDVLRANGLQIGTKFSLIYNPDMSNTIYLRILEKEGGRRPNSGDVDLKIPKEEEIGAEEMNIISAKLVLKSHNQYNMPVPAKFARKTGLKSKDMVMIKDNEGRKWVMKVNVDEKTTGQVVLMNGWKDLCQDNGLGVGAAVLLKFGNGGGRGDEFGVQVLDKGVAQFLYGRPSKANADVSVFDL